MYKFTPDGKEVLKEINEVDIQLSKELSKRKFTFTWDASGFSGRIYYCKIEAGEFHNKRIIHVCFSK